MRFVDPKNDMAFKKIFGNSARKDILISFLNAALKLPSPIKDIEFASPYQLPLIKDFKDTFLDVKAVDNNGREFIVEMQIEGNDCFGKRSLYYLAKSYVNQIKKGDDYKLLKPAYFIGVLNFNLFEGKSVVTRHILVNQEENRQDLKDFELNFIELKKFNKTEDQLVSIIDKWIFFLKNAEDLKVIPETIVEKEIIEAFDAAEEIFWTKSELEAYDWWALRRGDKNIQIEQAEIKGRKKGIKEGREEGREEGIKKRNLEIAINLKKSGMTSDKIAEITGLNKNVIDKM